MQGNKVIRLRLGSKEAVKLKKNTIIVFLVFITLILASCNETNLALSNNVSYKIVQKKIVKYNIIINFPQILNLKENEKQKCINRVLKSDALKVLSLYDGEEKKLNLEINYDIKFQSKDLLSVKYYGLGYVKGGAYPNNLCYSTNINIKNGVRERLKDFVFINSNFVEKFLNCSIKYTHSNVKLKTAFGYIKENYTVTDLVKYFNKADLLYDPENLAYVYSYFTKDSLGISMGVPHAIGDHAEFEMKYKDIVSYKKTNLLWRISIIQL